MGSPDDALYAPIKNNEEQPEGDLAEQFRTIIERIKKKYEETLKEDSNVTSLN